MPRTEALRGQPVLREMYETAQRYHARHQHEFTRGVVAALGWVLSEVRLSPATERFSSQVPTVIDVVHEYQDAGDVPYGRGKKLPLNRSYAVGVEHALMWAVGATDDPPAG